MLFKHALVPNAAHERHELALISCGDAGSTVVFTKSHDFVGPYEIGIVVANRIPMPLPAKRPSQHSESRLAMKAVMIVCGKYMGINRHGGPTTNLVSRYSYTLRRKTFH